MAIIDMNTPITDALRQRMLESFAAFHQGEIYAEDAAAQFSEIFQQVGILEKDRDHWRANHDNQKKLKEILTDRPDLGDRAKRMQELIQERDQYKRLYESELKLSRGLDMELQGVRKDMGKEVDKLTQKSELGEWAVDLITDLAANLPEFEGCERPLQKGHAFKIKRQMDLLQAKLEQEKKKSGLLFGDIIEMIQHIEDLNQEVEDLNLQLKEEA